MRATFVVELAVAEAGTGVMSTDVATPGAEGEKFALVVDVRPVDDAVKVY